MNDGNAIALIFYSVVWLLLCVLIAWRVRGDIAAAHRREARIEAKGVNGTLAMVARYATRATYQDLYCVGLLGAAAALTLLIRYIDFATPHNVDVALRYLATTLFVLALVPFYQRVRDRRNLAEELMTHAPELSDDA